MEEVLRFLKARKSKLCVLATASKNGVTESAVVGFVVKDDLTIIASTRKVTRKYQNIQENPHVSFVTGWGFDEANVQIDGQARIVEPGDEYSEVETFFFTQNPDARNFKAEDTIFIVIKPTWFRFIDHTTNPPKFTEANL